MRTFIFQGKEYQSLSKACADFKVSYQKARRLCRHYVRANKDPAVALKWILGIEKLSHLEPKTFKYQQDLECGRERQERFKANIQEKVMRILADGLRTPGGKFIHSDVEK